LTNYSRGADFERTVKRDLEAKGYFAIRSAGSHGAVDIIAIKKDDAMAVQCKINGRLSPADRKQLLAVAHASGIKAMKAWRPKRGVIEYVEI
jgi:Holliday junction resolvase